MIKIPVPIDPVEYLVKARYPILSVFNSWQSQLVPGARYAELEKAKEDAEVYREQLMDLDGDLDGTRAAIWMRRSSHGVQEIITDIVADKNALGL